MTPHRLIPLLLLAAAAGCSGDSTGPSPAAQAQSSPAVPSPTMNHVIASMPAPAMDEMIPSMPSQAGCGHLTATLYGHHEAATGWVGNALVSLDGGAPEAATFVDVNKSVDLNALLAGRPFRGTEVLTLTFSDGATIAEDARFLGVPASAPDLYELHETGTISGTGRFGSASGHVAVAGPFLSPAALETPPWIGMMTGWICE